MGPTGEFSQDQIGIFRPQGANRDVGLCAWAGRPRPKRCRAARGYPGVQGAGGPGRVAPKSTARESVVDNRTSPDSRWSIPRVRRSNSRAERSIFSASSKAACRPGSAGSRTRCAGTGRAQRRLQRRQPPAHRGLVDVKRAGGAAQGVLAAEREEDAVSSQFMAVFLMHFRISLIESAARPRHPRCLPCEPGPNHFPRSMR